MLEKIKNLLRRDPPRFEYSISVYVNGRVIFSGPCEMFYQSQIIHGAPEFHLAQNSQVIIEFERGKLRG